MRARRRRRAAAAIAGIAAAGSLAVSATPAHAAPAGWSVTAVINVGARADQLAEDMRTRTVWVANWSAGTVTEVSERTDRVLAVIPVGVDPDAIAADPRTGLVWVVNGGADPDGPADGSVSVISERARKVVGAITVGPSADGVAVDSRSGRVFVSDGNFAAPWPNIEGPADGFVQMISERARKVTGTASVGPGGPLGVAVAGGKVFVPYFGGDYGGAVAALDERTGAAAGGFGAGFREGEVAADPRAGVVWVTSVSDNGGYGPTVTGFSDATGKELLAIPDAGGPIATDPAAGTLWAAGDDADGGGNGTIEEISETTGAVTATVPLAAESGMAVDPCTGDVYVSDSETGTVTVVSQG
jgi:DNA-binding beta-propeller fold protein YncE